jgi:hypothetical protein
VTKLCDSIVSRSIAKISRYHCTASHILWTSQFKSHSLWSRYTYEYPTAWKIETVGKVRQPSSFQREIYNVKKTLDVPLLGPSQRTFLARLQLPQPSKGISGIISGPQGTTNHSVDGQRTTYSCALLELGCPRVYSILAALSHTVLHTHFHSLDDCARCRELRACASAMCCSCKMLPPLPTIHPQPPILPHKHTTSLAAFAVFAKCRK